MAKGQRNAGARRTVLAALKRGATVAAAAREAGVSRRTPYQWAYRGDTEMAAALKARRDRRKLQPFSAKAHHTTESAWGVAVAALLDIAQTAPDAADRIRACVALLKLLPEPEEPQRVQQPSPSPAGDPTARFRVV